MAGALYVLPSLRMSLNLWVGTSMLIVTVELAIGEAAIRDGCNPLQCQLYHTVG